TGANLNETVLTTSSVNASQFGKLFEHAVDGDVFAQPLYVPSLTMADGTVHNVVYAATMHNTVYAFDADTNAELWQMAFGASIPVGDVQHWDVGIRGEVGILSTPVIDPSSNSLFVLVRQRDADGTYHQRLHKLDLTRAADRATIEIAFPDTAGAPASTLAKIQNQRA